MRVAIWAAVSTVSQATPDKISIQVQIMKGREFIASRAYQPAGEYIAPGESRTKYISLYHAEKEIEPLHALLEAASRKEFDLLYIYDLNRFRTLMRQIFDVLCDYGIQLYIHTNPRDPVPPSQYTEEHKTAVGMIVDFSNIISRNEITNLARHFQEKMPGRIDRGLDARLGSIPYGYKRIHPGDKTHPLIIDPEKANIIIQIKDWYLAGWSLKAIAQELNKQNIPSPQGSIWRILTVRIILTSPYYAGIVYFGIHKTKRNRRTGTANVTINPAPKYGTGKHTPLWDETTHTNILQLIEERGRGMRGVRTRRLTALLRCECGKKLYYSVSKQPNRNYWRCSSHLTGHTYINDQRALQLIIPKIVADIRNTPNITEPKAKTDLAQNYQQEIKDLEKKQQKWMDLYETDSIPLTDLTTRLKRIQTRLDQIRSLVAKQQATQTRKQATQTTRQRLTALLDNLEHYYLNAPPHQVNTDLRTILESITITKDETITLHWR